MHNTAHNEFKFIIKHFSQYILFQCSKMKINKLSKHNGEDVMNVSTEIAEEKTDKDTTTGGT